MIIYQMIFWYHKTILGNGNYENHSVNPFNAEWTNPLIWRVFLSEQLIEEVFCEMHVHIWIETEKTTINFDELFDEE